MRQITYTDKQIGTNVGGIFLGALQLHVGLVKIFILYRLWIRKEAVHLCRVRMTFNFLGP